MPRVLALVACLIWLAGCASTPSYRYYGERTYSDGYGGQVVASSSSATYYRGDWDAPLWYDYPGYYSLFWSINRWYVDPYWYPHFYYGVTWFPRDYFSVVHRHWYGPSLRIGWYGRPWYGYLAYSPYRYSWVDNYYDWYPWYAGYPHYHRYYTPRYGNPRNEAERLSRYSEAFRGDGLPAGQLDRYSAFSRAARSQAVVDARRDAWRGADYGSDGRRTRIDPGVSGFRQGDSPRAATPGRAQPAVSSRQDPRVSGFREPDYRGTERPLPARSAPGRPRGVGEEGVAYPYRSTSTPRERPTVQRPSVERREVSSGISLPATRARSTADSAPRIGGESRVVESQRSSPRAAPQYRQAPAMSSQPPRTRSEAPAAAAPRYAAPAPPRYETPSRQAPSYQAPRYEAPRREAAPAPAPRSYAEPAPRERPAPVMRGDPRQPRPAREEE